MLAPRADAGSQVNVPRQAHAIVLAEHFTVERSAPKVADPPEVEDDAPGCVPAFGQTQFCAVPAGLGRIIFKLARAMRHAHALPAVGRRIAIGALGKLPLAVQQQADIAALGRVPTRFGIGDRSVHSLPLVSSRYSVTDGLRRLQPDKSLQQFPLPRMRESVRVLLTRPAGPAGGVARIAND